MREQLTGDLPHVRHPNCSVYLPIIVLAELYFGAEKSPDPERKRQQIDRFLPLVEVLQTTEQTARKYGVIKAELEARGERIPDNDIWIAALD